MKTPKAKLSEIHHGKRLYFVDVYVDRGAGGAPCFEALHSHYNYTAMGRPYSVRLGLKDDQPVKFVDVQADTKSSSFPTITTSRSMGDCAVEWHNGRNLHRCFTKRKHADRYVNRINSGCLTHAEREHLNLSVLFGRMY